MSYIFDSHARVKLYILLLFITASCSSYNESEKLLMEARDFQQKAEQSRFNFESNREYISSAINLYSQVISLDELNSIDMSEVFLARGNLYLMLNDSIHTIDDFSNSIKLNQNNTEAFYRRSIAYQVNDKSDRALSDLDYVIQLYPEHPFAQMDRATIYYDLNEMVLAEKDLSAEITKDQSNYIAFTMRGSIYSMMRDYDHAISDFNIALNILTERNECPTDDNSCFTSDLVNVYQNLAVTYQEKGDYLKVKEIYKKGIEKNPGSSILYNSLAWLLATADNPSIRDPEKALEYALKANSIENSLDADVLDTELSSNLVFRS